MLVEVALTEQKRREPSDIHLDAVHVSAIVGLRVHLEDAEQLGDVTVELVNRQSIVRIVAWVGKYLHDYINGTVVVVVCHERIIILGTRVGLLETDDHRIGHLGSSVELWWYAFRLLLGCVAGLRKI